MSAVTSRTIERAGRSMDRAGALPVTAPRPAIPGVITLGALLARAGDALRSGLPEPLWVLAAVAAAKPVRGGHMLELVEAEAGRTDSGLLRAYLPDAILAPLSAEAGRAVAAAEFAGMTIVLQLRCEFHPKWGLGARVVALAPGIEASLARRALEAAIARLGAEGLLDRQRRLPAPADITAVAVVHPPAAAGWADVAGELQRWQGAGILAVRSVPTAFEGPGAAAELVRALATAVGNVDGRRPDAVLMVRGGGARVGLVALDDEALARAIAASPVPVVTGVGHQTDRSLCDRVAWRATDTPSKALALLRDLIAAPARRARLDHAAIMAAVSTGAERSGSALDAFERRVSATALQRVLEAARDLGSSGADVTGAVAAARERCGRLADAIDRRVAEIASLVPAELDKAGVRLATLVEAIRSQARTASEAAPDGSRLLAGIEARVAAHREAASADLARVTAEFVSAPPRRIDQVAADLAVLAEAIRARARDRCVATDDGARHLGSIEARVKALVEAQQVQVEHHLDRVHAALPGRLDALAAALDRARAVLDAHDPGAVLARGFALAIGAGGHALTSAAAARDAGTFTLQFHDGEITVAVHPTPKPNGTHHDHA